MRPSIALSAVVLPAPLGPISPRMRPSSTRRSIPSSATVVPNDLRMPRASMHAMVPGLLLSLVRIGLVEQLFGAQPQPLNGFLNPGPLFGEKFLAFALQQQITRARIDEHTSSPPGLNQSFIYELLIPFENRERIHPKFGRDIAHGR